MWSLVWSSARPRSRCALALNESYVQPPARSALVRHSSTRLGPAAAAHLVAHHLKQVAAGDLLLHGGLEEVGAHHIVQVLVPAWGRGDGRVSECVAQELELVIE